MVSVGAYESLVRRTGLSKLNQDRLFSWHAYTGWPKNKPLPNDQKSY